MVRAKPPHLPQIPAPEDLAPITVPSALDHDESHTEFRAEDCSLPGQAARGLTVASARLEGVNLSESTFDSLYLNEAALIRSDLANTRAARANLTRVSFESARLTGLALTDSILHDVTFRGCRLDLSSFGLSRLKRVVFDDCNLAGISLLEAQCESVVFRDCRMTECDFRGAILKTCEFQRCDLAGIEGIQSLRGAAMEWGDIIDMAGTWAAALGIQVIEP